MSMFCHTSTSSIAYPFIHLTHITSYFSCRPYLAPEFSSSGIITLKTDIYSLGVIIIEILMGCTERTSVDKVIIIYHLYYYFKIMHGYICLNYGHAWFSPKCAVRMHSPNFGHQIGGHGFGELWPPK